MTKWLAIAGVITSFSLMSVAAGAQGTGKPAPVPPPPAPAAPQSAPSPGSPTSPIVSSASANYVLGPNDRIRIRAIGLEDISGEYTLSGDGTFGYTYIGEVKASGLTIRELENYLRKTLIDKGIYRDPQISIGVLEYRSKNVDVLGAVGRQGRLTLTSEMGIIEALAAAGGLSANAADHVWIIRSEAAASPVLRPDEKNPNETRTRFDLAPLRSGRQSTATFLKDGDTLWVPELDRITVTGEVRNTGEHPIRSGTTLREALAIAGGPTDYAALNRVEIIREENGKRRTIKDAKMDEVIHGNDIINVPRRRL